jgi:hypothetical protein
LSALCRAVAPAQVHVTYSSDSPLAFSVEWCGELGPVSFAGTSPDDAAERAMSALRGRMLLPEPHATVSDPLAQAGWVEAMRERIQAIEEGKPLNTRKSDRRANLRLVRS